MRGIRIAALVAGLVLVAFVTPALAQPPSQACQLLDTVAAGAATIQSTVQSSSGQQLPVDLASTIKGIESQAGCGSSGSGEPSPDACSLLGTVKDAAATIQSTVQSSSGQQLPVDLPGQISSIAEQAGCPSSPLPGGAPSGPPDQFCSLIYTVRDTARTIQSTAQSSSGQAFPVDLASQISSIAAQAGCGPSSGGGAPGGPPDQACSLVATLASTAATIQSTVQSSSGQAFPVDLASQISSIAVQAGCKAPSSGSSGGGSGGSGGGSGGSGGGSSGGSGGGSGHSSGGSTSAAKKSPPSSGKTAVMGAHYSAGGKLPVTGAPVLRWALVGAALLALGGVTVALGVFRPRAPTAV